MMVINNHSSIVIMPAKKIVQNCNMFSKRPAGYPVKTALIVAGKYVVNTNRIDFGG